MNRKITLSYVFAVLAFQLLAQTSPVYFADYPSVSPNGQEVVFSYDADLWKVGIDGGLATRITAMEGAETNAKISPDGQWIAFSNGQYQNVDVYLVSIDGGTVKRLTFHQAPDFVSTWSWDSQTIYFTSNRYNRITTYGVSIEGGTPQRLFEHYFNNVHNIAFHPNGQEVLFNESWESSNFVNRKGYVGAFNPEIKSYNLSTKNYQELTNYEGKDLWPIFDRNGNLYYTSDAYNKEYNLYTLNNGKPTRLTKFEASLKYPSISADGSTIVFQKEYQIWKYDTKSKRTKLVPIQVVRNNTLAKTQNFNTNNNISDFDISPDGEKFCFVSRGELFVSDAKGKFVKQIPTRTDGRVLEVHWLTDNKTILFNQTTGGYQNWFTVAADGSAAEQQHTSDLANNRNLTFNSDRSQAVYLSGREEVRIMDLENMSSSLLCKKELWGFYNDLPYFTPDDQHIIFSAYENFEREIYLCNIATKQVNNLTNTAVTEASPFVSPDGKYIYFTTNRTKPSYPYGLRDADLYRMAVQDFDQPFKSDRYDALFQEKEEKEEEDSTKQEMAWEIDQAGLMQRLERVGPSFGTQFGAYVIQKGDKTTLVYSSNHDEGSNNLWTTVIEPFERPKTKKIEGARTGNYNLKTAKQKYYTLVRGKINEINLGSHKVSAIDIDYTFRRNLRDEFHQMFFETWANLEENFYSGDFHGLDWPATRDEYAQYLGYVNNRGDLRLMTNDMLGELNTSHFGFRSSGKEENTYYTDRTLATGILFKNDAPYTVERIVAKTPAAKHGKDIQAGDRLVAVNGKQVETSQNRNQYFVQPSYDEELTLTFARAGEQHDVKLHPVNYFSVRNALYDEWEAQCQQIVDSKGQKRIAYVHMKNMTNGELQRFLHDMVSEGQQRDALILDLRWNTGGNVHDDVLQFLAQKPYLQWKFRDGALTPQSNFGPAVKPIILLTNEQSLSDAEMTAAGFKELGLGTIIGTETYRWIIFTSGKGLVDGSFYRLPAWGCYTLDGKNIEKTGVAPDIEVRETLKDRLDGNDPQLARAIEEIMKQLK